jgi:C4-dicarboxylate transporter DctM subunit
MVAWLITAVILVLFALGLPIVLCMGLWVVLISYFVVDLSLANMGQTAWYGLENFSFLALPLFILTGDLVLGGGIARRLAAFANALVAWARGGLAMATIMACGFFASISGSNAATTATMGSIMIPEMTRRGYDRVFATATAAAGGTVGVIIPPSIIYIVYGIIMNVPPVDLFVAGLVPGTLMVVFMMLAANLAARFRRGTAPVPEGRFSAAESARTAWGARHGFVAVGLILGSVYLGIFSPTESAALAVVYAWVAGVFFTREMTVTSTVRVIHRSAQINGLLVPIAALAVLLQQAISLLGVTEMVGNWLAGFGGRGTVTFVIMVIILLVGTVFESVPNVIMTAPVLAPAAYAVGIDPIQFAMIFLLGDTLGFITWPYGLNLFVASSLTGIPYMRVSVAALWYCVALLVPWIIVAAWPWASLGLLGLMGGR